MHHLMEMVSINLPMLMIRHMKNVCSSSKHALPYENVISYILRHEWVPESGGSVIMEKFLDLQTLTKMSLKWDERKFDWVRVTAKSTETPRPAKRIKTTAQKKRAETLEPESSSTKGTDTSSTSASESSSAASDHLSDKMEALTGKVDMLSDQVKKLAEKVDKAVNLMTKSFEKVLSKLKKKKKH